MGEETATYRSGDIVHALREAEGGMASHAVIPDHRREPDWYKRHAALHQEAAHEIVWLRAAVEVLTAEVEALRQVVRLLHYRFDDHFTRVWWELDTDLVALTREQAAAVQRAQGPT